MKKITVGSVLSHIFLVALCVVIAFPLFCTFMSSFKTNFDIMKDPGTIIPKNFTLENYPLAWKLADFKTYTMNSIVMSVTIVIGTLLFSSMAGYGFARSNFKGKNAIFIMFTATMFLGFGSITIYPSLQIAKFLHINNSIWGVVLMTVLGTNITNLFLCKNYLLGLDNSIEEAAEIDGCGFFGRFFFVALPLMKPILATMGILSFVGSWNNYLLPMIFTLANPKAAPLTVGIVALKGSGAGAASWNLMLAGTVISILPIIIIYLIFNKQMVKGITAGGVKG